MILCFMSSQISANSCMRKKNKFRYKVTKGQGKYIVFLSVVLSSFVVACLFIVLIKNIKSDLDIKAVFFVPFLLGVALILFKLTVYNYDSMDLCAEDIIEAGDRNGSLVVIVVIAISLILLKIEKMIMGIRA